MYGAILGDIIGSPYEFNAHNYKAKDFPLFNENSQFTDDTVMTLAVAKAFMDAGLDASREKLTKSLFEVMPEVGKKYPNCGYGGMFYYWITRENQRKPFNSFGNGSAMRVSSVAWLYDNLGAVSDAARTSASVSHNHPEGIKGAESVATAIFLARRGDSKEEIKQFIEKQFGYDLNRTCDEIRPNYRMDETCQGSVPEAIIAFLEGENFEDVIRNAVSLGGDSDTIACIAGSIAEAYYGVPEELKAECRKRLSPDLLEILNQYDAVMEKKYEGAIGIENGKPLQDNLKENWNAILKAFKKDFKENEFINVLRKYNIAVYNYGDYVEILSTHAMNPHREYSLVESLICLTYIWRASYAEGTFTEKDKKNSDYFVNQVVKRMSEQRNCK